MGFISRDTQHHLTPWVTSWNMADTDAHEWSSDETQTFTGIIDQRIERFLWQLVDEPKKDVASELVADFDIEELRYARERLFDKAKTKAQRNVANGRVNGADKGSTISTDPWNAIKRRQVNLIAIDICDLYMYITNMSPHFPYKMLRRKLLLNTRGKLICAPALDAIMESDEKNLSISLSYIDRDGQDSQMLNEDSVSISRRKEVSRSSNDERLSDSYSLFGESDYGGNKNTADINEGNSSAVSTIVGTALGTIFDSRCDNLLDIDENGDMQMEREANGDTTNETYNQLIGSDCDEGDIDDTSEYKETEVDRMSDVQSGPDGYPDAIESAGVYVRRSEVMESEPAHGQTTVDSPPKGHDTQSDKETPQRDNVSTDLGKDNLNLSQASFVREILEIHDRIISSSPIQTIGARSATTSTLTAGKGAAATKETPQAESQPEVTIPESKERKCNCALSMATQTGPNMIRDPLIKRSEFDSQFLYVEQSLTDHERRLRSTEIWREKSDRKVDKIDADYYNQIHDLKVQQETMQKNYVDLIQRLEIERERLSENNSCSKITECSSTDTSSVKGTPKSSTRKRKRTVSSNKAQTCKKVGRKSPIAANRSNARRNESVYQTLMRAAKDVLSPRVQDKGAVPKQRSVNTPSVSVTTRATKNTMTPLPKQGLRTDDGEPGSVQRESAGRGPTASTPIPGQPHMNVSWADEDGEESRTIDAYLATLANGGPEGLPQRRGEGEPIERSGAAEQSSSTRNKDTPARTGPSAHTLRRPMNSNNKPPNNATRQAPAQRNQTPNNPSVSSYGGARPKQKSVGYATNSNIEKTKVANPPTLDRDNAPSVDRGRQNRFAPLADNGNYDKGEKAPPGINKSIMNRIYVNDSTKTNLDGSVSMVKDLPGNQGMGYDNQSEDRGSRSNVNDNRQEGNGGNNQSSYADMANKSKWLVQDSKKPKNTRMSPKSYPPIKGTRLRPHKDVFVRGVDKTEFESPEDLESALQVYCEERGVGTIFVKILTDKYESPTARCRICVFEADWVTVMDPDFWPEDVEVREWFVNPRDRKNNNKPNHEG